MTDDYASLPAWVRCRDGSQAPFEADRICQSLFAAAESLGAASAFLSRELTDVVLHFLAQESWPPIPTTADLAEHVEKIVREVGHPELARRYAELRRQDSQPAAKSITIACPEDPGAFVADCVQAYELEAIYSRDVAAALREGLLRLSPLSAPAGLASFVVETPRLAELPWWPALDAWHAVNAGRWIVDSPDWLCTLQRHPALTPHLCERLLALPTLAQRGVEMHLNLATPPAWALVHPARPLFTGDEDDDARQERTHFLDSLLERWKALRTPRLPGIAWHLHAQAFRDDHQRRQLVDLVRHALQGRPVRFIFDRPHALPALAEGQDRKCPGVLLEIGLDLSALARRQEIGDDAGALLERLPSLARIAVSAAQQKRRFLRSLPADAPLKQGFLLDRATSVVAPLSLDEVVHSITGAGGMQSPLSFDFAMQIMQTLRTTLNVAGRRGNLDLRLDGAMDLSGDAPPRRRLESAGKLHARAGAGNVTVPFGADTDPDTVVSMLEWTLSTTGVVRVQLQRAAALRQGELPI